jgi:hypothetical protein
MTLLARTLAKLSPDDYEEDELLRRFTTALKKAEDNAHLVNPANKTLLAEAEKEMLQVMSILGYDPRVMRPAKTAGRPRTGSIPDPLPPKDTVLTSCLGDEYTIVGYASTPRGQSRDRVVYIDASGALKVRSAANLFANTLKSGIPLVTYDGDPRGLKHDKPVPQTKGRSLSKRVLANDPRYADPMNSPLTPEERRRRY